MTWNNFADGVQSHENFKHAAVCLEEVEASLSTREVVSSAILVSTFLNEEGVSTSEEVVVLTEEQLLVWASSAIHPDVQEIVPPEASFETEVQVYPLSSILSVAYSTVRSDKGDILAFGTTIVVDASTSAIEDEAPGELQFYMGSENSPEEIASLRTLTLALARCTHSSRS